MPAWPSGTLGPLRVERRRLKLRQWDSDTMLSTQIGLVGGVSTTGMPVLYINALLWVSVLCLTARMAQNLTCRRKNDSELLNLCIILGSLNRQLQILLRPAQPSYVFVIVAHLPKSSARRSSLTRTRTRTWPSTGQREEDVGRGRAHKLSGKASEISRRLSG